MYQSKNNFKKAEWAFKNGIKQAVSWSWFLSPLLSYATSTWADFLYTGHVPALPTLAEPFTGWLWSTAEQGAASNCHWSRAWVQAGESKVSVKIGKVIRTALVKIWIFLLDSLTKLRYHHLLHPILVFDRRKHSDQQNISEEKQKLVCVPLTVFYLPLTWCWITNKHEERRWELIYTWMIERNHLDGT